MPSLQSAALRFQTTIVKENGQPFYGTIMPVEEGEIPSYDFSIPRLMLRTTVQGIVSPRNIILDDLSQRYIVASHGHSQHGGHFTFRLFKVNADFAWKRATTGKDTLTGLSRESAEQDLGLIPCLVEMTGRQFPDSVTNIAEETRRILTSAELALGDRVDDAIVRRIDTALGVTYGEIS
ncbi:hypothetical protein [Mesorhizobium sp. WSM2239]|uniref:Uncharacterized protein n=2 Tax=unclassified Mesorhizobium TaxID=325217 RepID=A0AAU8DEB8_9HYPH